MYILIKYAQREHKMTAKKHNPTTYDVAKHAGVSQMTVSRVLRGGKNVSGKTVQKVNNVIQELGYIHNKVAGALSQHGNNLVGVVLPTLTNHVFNDVMEGINDSLQQTDFKSVFSVSGYCIYEEQKLVYDLLSWRPKGLILCGIEHTPETVAMLQRSGTKVVEIMDIAPDYTPIDSLFGFSNYKLGQDMATHLLKQGYKNFAFIGAWGSNEQKQDIRAIKRYQGFSDVLHSCDMDWVIAHEKYNISVPKMGVEAMGYIMQHPSLIDAVYCSNDDLAMGAYLYCIKNNISVPKQCAIIGCNGLSLLGAMPQQITTTHTPRYEMGKKAAKHIISDTTTPVIETLKPELIVGETS